MLQLEQIGMVERLESLFEQSLVCVATADAEGVLLSSNRAFQNTFGPIFPSITNLKQFQSSGDARAPVCANVFELTHVQGCSYLRLLFSVHEEDHTYYVVFFVDATKAFAGEVARFNEKNQMLRHILDLSADGLQVVNSDGIITLVNRSFEEIHRVAAENVVGQHVTKVIENTRMHIVAKTGIAETGDVQRIGERRVVVSRLPILKDGKCVGAVGKIMFIELEEVDRLARRVEHLKQQLEFYKQRGSSSDTRYTFDDIVAVSPVTQAVKATAVRAAASDTTVLLLGESGVGKEVYAHSIHESSHRRQGPFVRVNCSAIVEGLFESELFGYSEGAFTGAKRGGKQGKFELANYGTIFLDEIADMPLEAQAKLLRVLQEQEIEKLGSEKQFKVDVRVLAATNQDLKALIAEGRFRKDLFYRLNVIPVLIPPLRQRKEDIPELIRLFWEQLKRKHGIYYKSLGSEALALLQDYEWPGNTRELRNVLERALAIVIEDTISAEQMKMILMGTQEVAPGPAAIVESTLEDLVKSTERKAISFALARSNNCRVQAAKQLGVSRSFLYKKIQEYGIT
jgi:PAS domain S-box-containing protein